MTTIVTASELERDAVEFLRFKRAMGCSYRRGEFELRGFVRFVAQHWGEHGKVPLDDAITRWCGRLIARTSAASRYVAARWRAFFDGSASTREYWSE